MKKLKYLFLFLVLTTFFYCKKDLNNDILPPVVTTGTYSIGNQVITGEVRNLSKYVVKFGHVWDTMPFPSLESALDSSVNDYNGELTDSMKMAIISPVNFLPDVKYYMVAYSIDEFEEVRYGQQILEYDPSDPAHNPIACFAASQSVCEVGNCSVNFDADCSTPENLIVMYKWDIDGDDFNDYTGADKQSINHPYNEAGIYRVKLEVLTHAGITDDTTYVIQVNESTTNLVACFNMSKTECDIDNCDISFDASCSQNETTYKWDFDGDGVSDDNEDITNHPYTTPGTYEVRLIVEDNDNNEDTTFQTIQVYDITADFDIPSGIIYEGCEVAFVNNSIGTNSYLWDFGDGNTSTEENPIHTYYTTGAYTITLTATVGGIQMENTQNINIIPSIKFEKIRDIGGNDRYNAVIISPDGGYVMVGRYTESQVEGDGDTDVYLIKTSANGNMLWEKTFGSSNSDDIAYSIISAPDGGYIMAGLRTAGWSSLYLIKTDANGNMQWEKTFGGIGDDIARSIVSASNDGYVIAGYTSSQGAGANDVYLIKTDVNGNMQWEKTFGGGGSDIANSIVSASDGGYVIAGHTSSQGAGSRDVYLIKTDANGNMLWEKTFGGSDIDGANSVVSAPEDGYLIAGYTETDDDNDVYIIKINANGNMLWEKTFGGGNSDIARSVKTTDDCGYIIAGSFKYSDENPDFYLIKTDSEGNTQ